MKPIEYQGKMYKSIKELCEINSLDYKKIFYRLNNGYSIDEAINHKYRHRRIYKEKPAKRAKVSYEGKEYTVADLSRLVNLPESTLHSRLKSGLSIEEALQKEFNCICTICGKEFVSKRPNKMYCSNTCQNRGTHGKGQHKIYTRVCTVCGKTYITDKGYNTKTCSKHCRDQLTRIDRNKRYKHLKGIGGFW